MGNSTSKSCAKSLTPNDRITRNINISEQSQMETEQSLAALVQLKERRRLELLAFEEEQAKRLQEEAQLRNSSKLNQNKFLNHITESQKELENMLLEVHQQQEASRQKFSEHLCRTEAEMEANISDVLKSVRAHRDQTQIQELVKAEENQSQTLLALKLEEFKNLRKDDILRAMKNQIEQDISKQTTNNLNKTMLHIVQSEDEAKNRQIEKILQHRQNDRVNLVMSLLEEESWQYQAFSSLLAQRDRRIALLGQDIRAVVDQLNQLTSWELTRKNRQIDSTTNALESNRLQLAEALSQLLEQQQLRRKDLKQLLEEMEAQRQNQAADYWLVQYQRLMDNIPESLQNTQQYLPSAPSSTEDGQVASAPPMDVFMETSCVICLDSTCQVIFLSCGHLCCCTKCGEQLYQCPMCRASISKRLQVHFS